MRPLKAVFQGKLATRRAAEDRRVPEIDRDENDWDQGDPDEVMYVDPYLLLVISAGRPLMMLCGLELETNNASSWVTRRLQSRDHRG